MLGGNYHVSRAEASPQLARGVYGLTLWSFRRGTAASKPRDRPQPNLPSLRIFQCHTQPRHQLPNKSATWTRIHFALLSFLSAKSQVSTASVVGFETRSAPLSDPHRDSIGVSPASARNIVRHGPSTGHFWTSPWIQRSPGSHDRRPSRGCAGTDAGCSTTRCRPTISPHHNVGRLAASSADGGIV